MSDEYERPVAPERNRIRDNGLNDRHREWGWNCPAMDIDFMMVEFSSGLPMALCEYKHEHAGRINTKHPSIKAMVSLANASRIPAFLCRYADDYSWFDVHCLNKCATDAVMATKARPDAQIYRMTEYEWVQVLYRVRGLALQPYIAKKLNGYAEPL